MDMKHTECEGLLMQETYSEPGSPTRIFTDVLVADHGEKKDRNEQAWCRGRYGTEER